MGQTQHLEIDAGDAERHPFSSCGRDVTQARSRPIIGPDEAGDLGRHLPGLTSVACGF